MSFQSALRIFLRVTSVGFPLLFFGLFSVTTAEAANLNITGTVTNPVGAGVQDVSVTATAPDSSTVLYGPVLTTEGGNYVLDVDAGTYDIHFVPAGGNGLDEYVYENFSLTENSVLNVQLTATTRIFSGNLKTSLGDPVKDARIILYDQQNNEVANQGTDLNGHFSLSVAPGQYRLLTRRSNGNYPGQPNNFIALSTDNTNSRDIDLTTGNLTADITLNVVKVTVTVKNSQGIPVSGVNVNSNASFGSTSIVIGTTSYSDYSGTVEDRALTNNNGIAEVYAFKDMGYTTSSGTSKNLCAYISGQPVCLDSELILTGNTNVTITQPNIHTFSGNVKTLNDATMKDVRIILYDQQNNEVGSTTSDDQGHFSLGVAPGQYRLLLRRDNGNYPSQPNEMIALSTDSSADVDLTSGDLTADIKADIVKVTVTVKNSNNIPIQGIVVESNANRGTTDIIIGTSTYSNYYGTVKSSDTTDNDGIAEVYAFKGLGYVANSGPGYNLCAYINGQPICLDSESYLSGDTAFTISEQTVYTFSGNLKTSNNEPMKDVTLSLYDSQNNEVNHITTNADGHFSVSAVPGTYRLQLRRYNGDYIGQPNNFIALTTNSTNSRDIDLTSSDLTTDLIIDVVKVTATIKDSNGTPLSGVSVASNANDGSTSINANGISYPDYSGYGEGYGLTNENGVVELYAFKGMGYTPNEGSAKNLCAYINGQPLCLSSSVLLNENTTILLQPANQPPLIGTITASTNPVHVNTAITATATFTDPDVLNIHTATANWGDGSTPTQCTISESNGSGTATCNGPAGYTSAGVYELLITVTDNRNDSDTNPYQYLTVYDQNAGWAAGSKEYTSPIGAVIDNPSITGKVDFGFQVKYQAGDIVPSGKNVEFSFPAANIDFVSTGYQWLTVTGTKATFKADGLLNGTAGYTILVSAIDQGTNQQKGLIRIQIKNGSTVVYDTQPGGADTVDPITSVTKGKISVH